MPVRKRLMRDFKKLQQDPLPVSAVPLKIITSCCGTLLFLDQWSPIYDVAAILTSIQSLLCDPNPNSPANSEAYSVTTSASTTKECAK